MRKNEPEKRQEVNSGRHVDYRDGNSRIAHPVFRIKVKTMYKRRDQDGI